jgi:monofunctional biosynthetic peptidoglycan transglycosylase
MTLQLPAVLTRPFARRKGLMGIIAKGIAVLVALPLVLTPIYAFVPPVSTLMLWSGITGQGMNRDWTPIDRISPAW